MRKLVAECLGTMFLILAIGLTGNPLAIGLSLAIMIYAGGHVSGGHYNPAVTLGIYLRKGISLMDMLQYWIAQCVGAALAVWLVTFLGGKAFGPSAGAGMNMQQVLVAEIIGTFALMLVILNAATSSKLKGNYVYGFAIGGTLTTMAYIFGPISGGAFNPAVALSGVISGGTAMSNLWIYIVGNLAGSILAVYTFSFTNNE